MFIVKGVVYPYDVMVYWGKKKKLVKILKKYDISLKGINITVGKCLLFPTRQTVIWLRDKPKDIGDLAVLQHEIFHAACFILEDVGIKYCNESDEAYAYLIQHLTFEIYKELNLLKEYDSR